MDNPTIKKLSPLLLVIVLLTASFLTIPAAAQGVTVNVRIEAQSGTLWSGTVSLSGTVTVNAVDSITGQTVQKTFSAQCPLGALHKASLTGGFNYAVIWYSLYNSLYVSKIAGESNWVYLVNNVQPSYGAAYGWLNSGPSLSDGDEVVWAQLPQGAYNGKMLRVTVDNTKVSRESSFTVTVEAANPTTPMTGNTYPAIQWQPVSGATVMVDGTPIGTTDSNGKLTINARDLSVGVHEIYAEKSGVYGSGWSTYSYIRSSRVEVTIISLGYTEEQLEALSNAREILRSSGDVAEAYRLLVCSGVIATRIPSLPHSLYEKLAEIYGPYLERYPSLEGRIQLLYSFGIECITS